MAAVEHGGCAGGADEARTTDEQDLHGAEATAWAQGHRPVGAAATGSRWRPRAPAGGCRRPGAALRSGKGRSCLQAESAGEKLAYPPYHQSAFHQVAPVYEELPGWRSDLSGATELSDLPDAARDYVAFLSEQVGVPIRLVGVGPGRDQFVRFAA